MSYATWRDLFDNYCSNKTVGNSVTGKNNIFFETLSHRRYNPSPIDDKDACRLTFLNSVLQDPVNKTLCRQGRFLWCKNLQYEGRSAEGYRRASFTVDKGNKRFFVTERDMLCIPSKLFVHNNRYFRSKLKTFTAFSTIFGYRNTIKMMSKSAGVSQEALANTISRDNPFKPGCLVKPRLGYFYPDVDWTGVSAGLSDLLMDKPHPCGIILGHHLADNSFAGREFYRVRFGDKTYERIHPVQMEIVNEV